MEWIQVLTIIVTLLGGIFYIHSDIREIKKDIQQQSARIDQQSARIDQQSARIDQQNARSDRLYEMFIDLLKGKNTP